MSAADSDMPSMIDLFRMEAETQVDALTHGLVELEGESDNPP